MTKYSYEEVYNSCLEYFNKDELAATVAATKYLLKDDLDGLYYEKNPDDMIRNRLCKEFVRIENNYPNPLNEEEIYEALKGFKYVIPQGSPMYGIGNDLKTMSLGNCFLIESPYDSYGGILKTDQEIVQIAKRRGGIGVDISSIRPKGLVVNNAAQTTDGIELFMQRYSNSTHEVAQCIAKGQHVLTSDGLKKIENVNIGDLVWTRVGWVKVNNILKNNKKMIKMTTQRGYKIKTSSEHLFLSREEKAISEKKMWSFKIGDGVLLIPGERVEKEYVKLNITDYKRKDGGEKGMKCSGGNSSKLKTEVTLPLLLEEKLAYFLGFSYGDGSVEYDRFDEPTTLSLACCHKYPEIQSKLEILCKQLFGVDATVKPGDGKLNKININSKLILMHLQTNGLLKGLSVSMTFPQSIIDSGAKVQSAFIAGYFDAAGYASGKKKGYVFSSVNFDFLENTKMILMSNGILTNYQKEEREVKNGWKDLHIISVVGRFFQKRLIEFFQRHSIKVNLKNHISKRDSCLTPYFPSDLNIKREKKSYINEDQMISCAAYERCVKDGIALNNILVLDYVKSIEHIESLEETYDLCLDEENLFWCEGFYVHNSGRRGALMISIDCHHPQIIDFIKIKRDLSRVTGANTSVKFTNDFFTALQNKQKFTLQFPVDVPISEARIVIEADPNEIWEEFVRSNHLTGEPGLFFWSNLITDSISDCYKDYGFITKGTNPCGELPLSPNSSCILMLLNLKSFVVNPFTNIAKFDYEKFIKMVGVATRLMDDLIDLEKEKITQIIAKIEKDPEPESVKSTELNVWKNVLHYLEMGRRVGLGVTGLADMLAELNIKYDSEESLSVCNEVFSKMHEVNFRNNAILAKERGTFGCWKWELEKDNNHIAILSQDTQDMIRKYGRRNISLSTIAPAGSVSVIAQTSSGIEPVYELTYTRKKKIVKAEEDRGIKFDSVDGDGNKWVKFTVHHHCLEDWMKLNPNRSLEESPYYNCTAKDINWLFRVKLQGLIQKYITHSISSTVNLPKTSTKEEIEKIYLEAWKSGCKGITVYRDGSRDNVLSANEQDNNDKNKISSIVRSSAPKRPVILPCHIHTSIIKGTKWVFLLGLLDGHPYEIFGGKIEAIDIPKKFIKGIESTNSLIRKNKNINGISSYDLVIGYETEEEMVIKDIANKFSPDKGSPTRLVSMLLRHGAPLESICEQFRKVPQEDGMLTFEKGISRVLRKYVADKTDAGGLCPECKNKLVYEGGCVKCSQCAWSRCD